ncbi:MAG: penicillin-binding protein 2 [SAR324 cluster bacterium]|nr:penicillin-binding protein 2 [SAR324 cluster bacterium]
MNSDPLAPEELQLFRTRTTIIVIVIALIFSLLASRLWYLQIVMGNENSERSLGNRIRLIPQAAPRGVIYDRNGVAIADNRPAYQLQLIREDSPDLERTLRNLSKALNIPHASLLKKLEDHRHQARFKPIILEEDLEYKKAAIIETYQEDFPGISIVVQSRRFYPHNKIAAHVLGYVGVRNEEQKRKLSKNQLSSGQIIGQASTELIHNETLIGTDGGKQIEVDYVGRELRIMNKPVAPVPGRDTYLTIDTRIQRFIHSIMRGESGAVVVMRPKTGEILAMGSFPNFNPNLFAAGINRKNWNRLMNNPDKPLQNKAIQGTYSPGSMFKLVTAYAGLEQKIISPETTYFCPGYYNLKGGKASYACWKQGGHGVVDLTKAIRESCNVFFYHVAVEMGVDTLHDYAQKFGFGVKTGINLVNEKSGLVPNSDWKLETFGERWYAGETPPVAIGQGAVSVTPLQIVNFINIIANNGKVIQPHLLLEKESEFQNLDLNQEYLELIRKGMTEVVNDPHGTAKGVRSKIWTIGAKTGTVQVISKKTRKTLDEEQLKLKKYQNHAWVVAFGPVEDPELSVAVLIEHGKKSSYAVPFAKKIFDYYIENYYLPRRAALNDLESQPLAQRLQAAFQ